MELLAREDARIETHTTIHIAISNSDIIRNYYFASAELTINGTVYQPQLRRGSQIKSSLTRAADQATVDLQNVDTEIGREFLSLGQALFGSDTKVGRFWKDLDSGIERHRVLLTGVLVGLQINENSCQVTAVSEPYANISVGATRRVTNLCQSKFREPNTCGYSGNQLLCNLMLNHADGCEGRHGSPLKQAKNGSFAYLNSKSRLVTQ